VPVKVKFSQIYPKISKIAMKISCIINMLKLCSFGAKPNYDLKSHGAAWAGHFTTRHPVHFSGSIRKIALLVFGMNNLTGAGYKVAILYLEKFGKFN